jgi:hypothetical protein
MTSPGNHILPISVQASPRITRRNRNKDDLEDCECESNRTSRLTTWGGDERIKHLLFSKLPTRPVPSGLSSVLIKTDCQATRHQTVYNNIARDHENASVGPCLHRTQAEYVHIPNELQAYILRAKCSTTNGEIQTGIYNIPTNA